VTVIAGQRLATISIVSAAEAHQRVAPSLTRRSADKRERSGCEPLGPLADEACLALAAQHEDKRRGHRQDRDDPYQARSEEQRAGAAREQEQREGEQRQKDVHELVRDARDDHGHRDGVTAKAPAAEHRVRRGDAGGVAARDCDRERGRGLGQNHRPGVAEARERRHPRRAERRDVDDGRHNQRGDLRAGEIRHDAPDVLVVGDPRQKAGEHDRHDRDRDRRARNPAPA
jgi:hypothetical protein